MHLAQIMEERTDSERDTFGKVNFEDLKRPGQPDEDEAAPASTPINYLQTQLGGNLSDEQITYITKVYLEQLQEPKELLNQCIQRSRDRYQREYAKMNAYQINIKFFSEAGIKDR